MRGMESRGTRAVGLIVLGILYLVEVLRAGCECHHPSPSRLDDPVHIVVTEGKPSPVKVLPEVRKVYKGRVVIRGDVCLVNVQASIV